MKIYPCCIEPRVHSIQLCVQACHSKLPYGIRIEAGKYRAFMSENERIHSCLYFIGEVVR